MQAPMLAGRTQLDSPALSEDVVPIIGGTGALGFGVGLRLARAGTRVVIGSRDAGRAQEAAEKLNAQVDGARAEGAENGDAAARGPIVLLSVPFRNQSENLTNLKGVLQPGQILVDATVPLAAAVSGRATRLLGVPQGSAGQQAAEMAPDGVEVVSALHTVSAATLNDLSQDLDEDVLVAGDSVDAKRRVAELIARIDGLRPVNAGRLEAAKLIEGLTPLLIGINGRYKTHAGVRISGLPDDLW
jgi:NADPH-dependent F420 reductase